MTTTLDLASLPVTEAPPNDYWFIQDAAEVPAALASLRGRGSDLLCLDTETTGLDAHRDQLLLLQLHVPGSPLLVFDCRTIPLDYLTEQVRPFLCTSEFLHVGHNLGFDYGMIFAKLGLRMERLYDTMLVERLLTAGTFADCGLGMTAERYLGVHLDKSVRKQFIGMTPDHEFTHEQLYYSAQDVKVLPPIVRAQQRRLLQQHMVEVARLEFEVLPALAEAHVWGVNIDTDKWRSYIQHCQAELEIKGVELSAVLQPYVETWRAQKEGMLGPAYEAALAERESFKGIRDLLGQLAYDAAIEAGSTAGEARRAYNDAKKTLPLPDLPKKPDAGTGPINLGSSEQVGYALLAMGVPIPVNENGRPITKKEVLEELADEHDAVAQLVAIRKLSKTIDSFGESILTLVDERGKLHPHFNQLVSTGRMSCIAADEPISVPGGTKPVQDVRAGDMVYTFDEFNTLTLRKVTKVTDMGWQPCVEVTWQAKTSERRGRLVCTPDHRVKTVRRGWVQADELLPGEPLVFVARSTSTTRGRPGLTWTGRNYEMEQLVIKREQFGVSDSSMHIHHRDGNMCAEYGLEYNHSVVSVKPAGAPYTEYRHVYDLTVEGTAAFVASEICVHNCSEPNVQQMSPAVRDCFIAPPGYALLSVDFHMIEMVILAEVTGEEGMRWAINAGLDLHSLTALKMFPEVQAACALEAPVDAMVAAAATDPAALTRLKTLLDFVKREFDPPRKVAKMINFGVAYGISAMGLSSKLHISLDDAKVYIKSYFATNPAVDGWLKRTGLAGQRALRSTTLLGRHRYFRPVRREDYTEAWMVGAAERRMARQVCNHVIQGSSADITKGSVVLVRQALRAGGWDAQMLAFVHDELLLAVAEEQLEPVRLLVEAKMVEAGRRLVKSVDVTVSASSGSNWVH